MAISFFEESTSSNRKQLPFIEDYVEENNPPYKPAIVTSVSRTRKKTGYMLNTQDFAVFMFEGSSVLTQLLEALNQWTITNEGYLLLLEPVQEDPYYRLGVDFDSKCRWVLTKGKYTWFAPGGSTSVVVPTSNPFLPPTQKAGTKTSHK